MLAADAARARPRLREAVDRSRLPDEPLVRHAVASAIRDLPEIYRAAIVLRGIHGLTTKEAGRRLPLKDQTLKSRLHRGRVMLRDRLRQLTTPSPDPPSRFALRRTSPRPLTLRASADKPALRAPPLASLAPLRAA